MPRRRKTLQVVENDATRSTSRQIKEPRRQSRTQPARFSNYIFKVLKQVHPQLSMTNKAMKVMDDFMHDIYSRLVSEAAGLVKFTRKSTLSAAEFQTATRLILPGELAKHAISDGTKAVANFLRSRSEDVKNAHSRRENIATTSTSTESVREPTVEIEIFGTVPRPVLNNSSAPRTGESDIEECIDDEELANESVMAPSNGLMAKKTTDSYKNLSRAEIQNSSRSNSENSSLPSFPVSASSSSRDRESMELSPVTVHDEAHVPPEKDLGKTDLPPHEEPGITTQVALDVTSMTSETLPPLEPTPPNQLDQSQVQDEGNDHEMDIDQRQPQCISSDKAGPSLIADAVSPNAENPPPVTDISLDPETPSAKEAAPKQPSADHQDSGIGGSAEGDSSLQLSQDSSDKTHDECGVHNSTNGDEMTEPESGRDSTVGTSVTFRCSKVITTKATLIHERKEEISEWISETEGCN